MSYTFNEIEHVVLWSGGVDSTLIIDRLLRQGESVKAVYIDIPSVHVKKRDQEYKSINKLMDIFHSKYGKNSLVCINLKIDIGGIKEEVHETLSISFIYPQPIFWLSNILTLINKKSIIYLGYLKSDGMSIYKKEYNDYFKSMQPFIKFETELKMPLLELTKDQVISELITRGLFEYTWTCEFPSDSNERCNNCVPCRTQISNLALVVLDDDKDVGVQARKHLYDIYDNLDHSDI